MSLHFAILVCCFGISLAAETNDFLDACKVGDEKYFKSGAVPPALIQAKDSSGRTCLHLAVENEKCKVVELVVSHAACNENVTIPETGETALMIAVKKQKMTCFRALVLYRPPLLAQRKDGMTALHLAATGSLPMTQTLAAHKELLDVKSNDGMTALMLAIRSKNFETAGELITKGADVKVVNNKGRTALHYAARWGNKELMIRLLNHGAVVDAGTTETPLLMAIKANQTNAALLLLNKDANPKAVNKTSGQSALFMALDVRNADIISLLITRGADLVTKGPGGFTPLILAAHHGVCDILKNLVDRTSVKELNEVATEKGNNALFAAIESNQMECLKVMVDKKVDLNWNRSSDGQTPLHAAVHIQNLNMTKYLFSSGAKPNAKDQKNRTPLSMALQYCAESIAEFLVEHTAKEFLDDQNMDAKWQQRPLHLAARCNFPKIVKSLVAKGADMRARDNIALQPLHEACNSGKAEAALALIESGADIDVPIVEIRSRTPLLYCSGSGVTDVVRVLIQKGAKIDGSGNVSFPLLRALVHNRTDVALLLIEKGAKTNVIWREVWDFPYDGDTALHLAARNANLPLVKRLIEVGADFNVKNAKGQVALDVASNENSVADFIKSAQASLSRSGRIVKN